MKIFELDKKLRDQLPLFYSRTIMEHTIEDMLYQIVARANREYAYMCL
jgi:hypothetical protein